MRPRYDEQWSRRLWRLWTRWCWDKITAISWTASSNAPSSMKLYEFLLILHCTLFLRIKLTIFQQWFRLWIGPGQAVSHYLNQWCLVYWCTYASLGPKTVKSLHQHGIIIVCLWYKYKHDSNMCSNDIQVALCLQDRTYWEQGQPRPNKYIMFPKKNRVSLIEYQHIWKIPK